MRETPDGTGFHRTNKARSHMSPELPGHETYLYKLTEMHSPVYVFFSRKISKKSTQFLKIMSILFERFFFH